MFPSFTNAANGYKIDNYDVEIKINENNSFDIKEEISVNFYESKHGIIRNIPSENTVRRNDGTISKNVATISNLSISDKYTISKENKNYNIKIGDKYKTLNGKKDYVIKYNYNIGSDTLEGADEFYFNIIGTEWDTTIENVNFKITLPKIFDKEKIGFSVGKNDTFGYDETKLIYEVNGNVITGSYNDVLPSNNGITIRVLLEDKYFTTKIDFTSHKLHITIIVSILFLLVAFVMWYKYGRDNKCVETIEFYPPNDFNSLEVGYYYKGKADNNDVVSLLIYLASKGYIKIMKIGKSDYKIIKLKDYDGTKYSEKLFMRGLFNLGRNGGTEILFSELVGDFYNTVDFILYDINDSKYSPKIYEGDKSLKKYFIWFMIAVLYFFITFNIVSQTNSIFWSSCLTLISFIGMILLNVLWKNIILKLIGIIVFVFINFITVFDHMLPYFINDKTILFTYVIGLISVFILFAFSKIINKRNKIGNEMLGKIRSFKHFLEVAEKENLESLVMKNPTYFYDILPYTYVLGVSNKWIKNFEDIAINAPEWYDDDEIFNLKNFNRFFDDVLSGMTEVVNTVPVDDIFRRNSDSDSSGGLFGGSSGGSGSSGGGRSGGGSGGGGGSSW